MKKVLFFLVITFLFVSCEKELTTYNKQITTEITTNMVFKSGKTYLVSERTKIKSGVVVTIEPGAVVKNYKGQNVGPEFFEIERGAKVVAEVEPQLYF
jgi:hypothetical protein